MTEKEQKLMDYTLAALASIHDAIGQGDVRPLADALRKLTAMQILIEAPEVKKEFPEVKQIYETPEKPKIDTAALDIIREPIADEVPLETPKEEPKPKRTKRVRVDDFDTPLAEKEEAMDRDQKILYYRAQGKTLAWIGEKVGCSPQTVANVVNRHKQKEIRRMNSEAAYVHVQGKGQQQ